jgi:hypothetical protein
MSTTLKQFLDSIAIVLIGSNPLYGNGGSKHPDLCSSCGRDVINSGDKFMLEWEQGGGMCKECVKYYRDRVGYYTDSELAKRDRRIKKFYFTNKQIAIRKTLTAKEKEQ